MVRELLGKLTQSIKANRAIAVIETESRQIVDNFTTEEVATLTRLAMKEKNKDKKKNKRVLVVCECKIYLTVKERVRLKRLNYFDKTKDIFVFQGKKNCKECKRTVHYIFFGGVKQ